MAKSKQAATDTGANLPTQGGGLGELRSRIVFLLLAIVVFRIGAHIPIPGINPDQLAALFQANEGTILEMINMFSGGALSRMSLFALGIMPYISASIIMQLMAAVVPQLEQLKKEGEQGRRKITQYTRYLMVVLAVVQAFGMSAGLVSQGVTLSVGVSFYFTAVLSLVTGTVFLMWLGEQITERGIGNGISMIIFAGIVAGIPSAIAQTTELARQGQLSYLVLLLVVFMAAAVVWLVVYIERGQRRITVNYARRQQGRKMFAGQQSHLPLKVNMAGVIPAIFASSILLFPASLAQWVGGDEQSEVFQKVILALSPGQPLYIVLFAAGIIFFCYFYTALMFNPKDVAENLKKSGAFIPGIRPGEQSAKYIDTVLGRLTLIGALYMTGICLLPMALNVWLDVPFYLGGTSLLIVVVVLMDFMTQVQSHLQSSQYEKIMKKNTKGGGGTGLVR